ncbi:hypothetical protein PLICRDRAFT_698563 [Plicaturopsis crispa FD-325 SS-3]|nr:hypothetical protein PLICRDRAFT_698563 [Plicaturopsis crispa FD-325 SS-3]
MDSDQQHAPLADTAPSDWRYVAEGGSTIVFSYIGAPHPRFSGTVLRMRKAPLDAPAEEATAVLDAAEFHRTVIERVVDPQWLTKLESVPLDREWVERFARVHDASVERPGERRQAKVIDVACNTAVLSPDLVGSEKLAVEIKPKWAFLPNTGHLSPATALAKTRTCRFCMHAHTKGLPTTYCPLDLFSTSPMRVRAAVGALWDTWMRTEGTVNNLRLFVYGKAISPANVDALHDALGISADDTDTTKLRDAFIELIVPTLLGTPVLRTISHLQRSLDPLDVEQIVHLTFPSDLPQTFPVDGPRLIELTEPEPAPDMWADFLEAYLTSDAWLSHLRALGTERPSYLDVSLEDSANSAAGRFARVILDRSVEGRIRGPLPNIPKCMLRYHVMAYLLSATFKDCSVMLRPLHEPTSASAASSGRVTIIDLDVKTIHRLDKWAKMDRDIAISYATSKIAKRCIPNGDGFFPTNNAQTQNEVCSIQWLPSELLADVFELCILEPHALLPTSSIVLSHVCKRWRGVSFDVPALWSQLAFRTWHLRDPCADLLQDLLDRSRDLGLSLTLNLGEYAGTCHRRFMRILGSSVSRARHVGITAPFADFKAMATDIDLDGSPHLESAEIIVSDVAYIAECLPRGFMERHFGLKGCPSLRYCRIQGYLNCTYSLLHNLNPAYLETLDIRCCTNITWNPQILAKDRLTEGNGDDRLPLFRRLRHLSIRNTRYDHPDSDIRLVGSSLLSLEWAAVNGTRVPTIFANFHSFVDTSAVQSLEISAPSDSQWMRLMAFLDAAVAPTASLFPACRSLTLSTIKWLYMNRHTRRRHQRFRFAFSELTRLTLVDLQPEALTTAFKRSPLLQDTVVVRPLTMDQSRAINDLYIYSGL